MSIKERLTSIVKKICEKANTGSKRGSLPLGSQTSEQKGENITEEISKAHEPMRARIEAGRYEVPTNDIESDLK